VTLRGLHHVQLAMPVGPEAEAAAEAFYAGVLGLRRVEKPPELAGRGGAWFRGSDIELHLGIEDPFAPARKAHPGILVDGLVALAGRLEAAGVEVEWDDRFPGFSRFYAHDPFGNRLELLEPS
jgi:catechol 2,3-dioxygenase-like lactoylglutathione lyase family enzyme